MESDPNAELLIDASITASSWWFLIGQNCLGVKGMLATPKAGAESATSSVSTTTASR